MHDDIGFPDLGPGTLDADALDHIVGLAQAGGVDQVDRHAFDADLLDDAIAGGAGDGGDDGDFGTGQRIQQAGLADVGGPGQHDVQALAQAGTVAGGGQQLAQGGVDGIELAGGVGALQEFDFFFGKVEGGFDQHAQVQQLVGQHVDLPGKYALQRAGGGARRLFGAGLDQVGDGFGLYQVELVVEEGALGEFARLGQAYIKVSTHFQHAAQQDLLDDGAAVALQLQHVLAGIGMGGGKPQGQPVVDGLAVGSQKGAVTGNSWRE